MKGAFFFVFWNLRFQKEGPSGGGSRTSPGGRGLGGSFGRGVPNKPWGEGSGGVLREGGPEQALVGGVWRGPFGRGVPNEAGMWGPEESFLNF